jgi:hypothetical protein
MLPATLVAVPATFPAGFAAELAAEVALSTRLVTAALRRYQITSRRMARLGLARLSGPFGGNGFNDALEQIAGAPSCEYQLGVGWIILQFGAQP